MAEGSPAGAAPGTGPSAVDVFEEYRPLLHGVAYRMLGSQTDAQDVVQEAWLRWDRADRAGVADPRAYLATIVTRLSIDHLRRAVASRESYVGPWLPEPLLTGPDVAEDAALADSVSMAMLVVLETLSPLERAVFVLREAFGFGYPDIAEVLGRTEEATRQLAHRAREHVRVRRPRFAPERAVRRAATDRFLDACIGGDLNALIAVLAPDVTLCVDSGGKRSAPRRPIHGVGKVTRFLSAVLFDIPADTRIHRMDINGGPAALSVTRGAPEAVLIVDVEPDSGLISTVRLIGNPEKLAHSARWGEMNGVA